MSAGDYDALKAEHEAFVKKTDAWKVKMKQITTKDRTEMARLKEEAETLQAAVRSANAVGKERAQRVQDMARRIEELEEIERAGRDTVVQYGALKEAAAEAGAAAAEKLRAAEAAARDSEARCARKDADVQALRQRVLALEAKAAAVQKDLEGADLLSDPSLAFHRRATHLTAVWLLCSAAERPVRWFTEDAVIAAVGRARYAAIPPVASDEDAAKASAAHAAEAQLAAVQAQAAAQKSDAEHTLRQKEGEIAALQQRLTTLQEQFAQANTRQQEGEAAKLEEVEKEVEARLALEYQGQLQEVENDYREAAAQRRAAAESRDQLAAEFADYKRRVQKAAAAPKPDAAPQVPQAELGRVKAEHAAAVEELECTTRLLREAEKAKDDVAESLAASERKVAEAIAAVEVAERERYAAVQELRCLKAAPRPTAPAAAPAPAPALPSDAGASAARLQQAEAARDEYEKKWRAAAAALKSVTDEMRRKMEATEVPLSPIAAPAPRPPPPAAAAALRPAPESDAGDDAPDARAGTLSSLDAGELAGDSGFDLEDLVAAAELAGKGGGERSELELVQRKLKRTAQQLSDARQEADRARRAAAENGSWRARAAELERSLERQDASRSADYLKNAMMQFALAKGNDEVQHSLVPLLSSLLHLSPAEQASLVARYPAPAAAAAMGGWYGSVGSYFPAT